MGSRFIDVRIFTALKAHGHGLTVHTAKSQVPNESPTMASTPASTGVMDVLNDYADYITAEQQIREDVRMRLRECEQSCRELNAVLQKIHTSGDGGEGKKPE